MKKQFLWFLPVVMALVLLVTAVWFGWVPLNKPSRQVYPVRGVDVSHYQGEIQWEVLARQDISFAFIKATEGSGFTDECFTKNFRDARSAGLRVGAYHFFSFDSCGKTQAEHFIRTVAPFEGMLPPVVDFEFYGDKWDNPPDITIARQELDTLLTALEAHYGMKPILYATEETYDLYLSGEYEHYDIWIRNVISSPRLSDGRDWTFWQYSNRGGLEGFGGTERYIDLNVFCGTREAFLAYPGYEVK